MLNIIIGADGHVGSATAKTLLDQGKEVLVVLHSAKNQETWQSQGAQVRIADVNDVSALKNVFTQGGNVFVLNPPAASATDTIAVETQSVNSILEALTGSSLTKIVAQSTYGAQPGDGIGDLGVLYKLEQGLAKLDIPYIIIRAAYYMSNWDMAIETAQQEGVVHTLYPVEFKLPMVAPDDIGSFSAQFLLEPVQKTEIRYVEGPQKYSSADVTSALSDVLGKNIKAVESPPEQWVPSLTAVGFSDTAARSMAVMTKLTLANQQQTSEPVYRGHSTLLDYFSKKLQD